MARILLGFFIPHWGLPYAQSPISKTFYQLGEFPRELTVGFRPVQMIWDRMQAIVDSTASKTSSQ